MTLFPVTECLFSSRYGITPPEHISVKWAHLALRRHREYEQWWHKKFFVAGNHELLGIDFCVERYLLHFAAGSICVFTDQLLVRYIYWKAEVSFFPGNYHLHFYAGRDRRCHPRIFDIPRGVDKPRCWGYEVQFFQGIDPMDLRGFLSKVLSDEELDSLGIIPGFVQAEIRDTACYKILQTLLFITDMEAEK